MKADEDGVWAAGGVGEAAGDGGLGGFALRVGDDVVGGGGAVDSAEAEGDGRSGWAGGVDVALPLAGASRDGVEVGVVLDVLDGGGAGGGRRVDRWW